MDLRTDVKIIELQHEVTVLADANAELMKFKQEYSAAKQSLSRMSARLRKLCKRLTPANESLLELFPY